MLEKLPADMATLLHEKALTYHEHTMGVPVSYYSDESLGLSEIFTILGTAVDLDG